jgi:predicted DNA-binding transcriptional regulator YafY
MLLAMLETSARLLRLLGLLQTRQDWTGPRLADELGVTTRTVRKDVERLRTLGYPVHAAPGVAGGYRLGAGTSLPPLLLDDQEAVAVAVGLRTASAGGGVADIEATSLRALAKLEQVLPTRLQRRVRALHDATTAISPGAVAVPAAVLGAIASAIRDLERLRVDYEDFEGRSTLRALEPHRLVHTRGRWYLVAWDVDRDDWRTFRVDRMRPRAHTGPRFSRRADPGGDLARYVQQGIGSATWRRRARVRVHAPAAQIVGRVPPAVVVEAVDERTCYANVGSDSAHDLALWLALLDADFDVGDDRELAEEVRALGRRFARAAG